MEKPCICCAHESLLYTTVRATSKSCCSSWKMSLEVKNQVNRKSILYKIFKVGWVSN